MMHACSEPAREPRTLVTPMTIRAASSRPRKLSPLDSLLRRVLGLATRLPSFVVLGPLLASLRTEESERQLEVALPRAVALTGGVLAADPAAIRAFDEEVGDVVEALRSLALGHPLARILAAVDRLTLARGSEYCDDPSCAPEDRRAVMDCLAFLNDGLGSYELWANLMMPDLARRQHPTRVLDLATGHGGFALALKARFGPDVEVTATDIFEEYLALGRAEAGRRGLDVRFEQQDATALGSIAPGDYDVVVCTQSIHHFSPGMVARVIGEASRIAGRAVWLVDGERTIVGAALLALVASLDTGSWAATHDTFVSLRKMYAEEELAAIARMSPAVRAGSTITTGRVAPGFTYLRASPWSNRASPYSATELFSGSA